MLMGITEQSESPPPDLVGVESVVPQIWGRRIFSGVFGDTRRVLVLTCSYGKLTLDVYRFCVILISKETVAGFWGVCVILTSKGTVGDFGIIPGLPNPWVGIHGFCRIL
jgi:hypothetical protein